MKGLWKKAVADSVRNEARKAIMKDRGLKGGIAGGVIGGGVGAYRSADDEEKNTTKETLRGVGLGALGGGALGAGYGAHEANNLFSTIDDMKEKAKETSKKYRYGSEDTGGVDMPGF